MRNRRFARRLLCLFILSYLTPGCQLFHGDPTITVLVRDAETKQPIPTAEVYLCQLLKDDEIAPCRSRELTQANGIARLRAEPDGDHGIQVQAMAQGYLPEKQNMAAEAIKKSSAASSSHNAVQSPPDLILEVYSEPAFSVELLLPPGYRGLVKAEIHIQDNLPLPRGQRIFRFSASPTGDVQVIGPPLLQRVPAPEYRARYANGPLLNTTMDVEKIGFRWIKGTGNCHYFVIGNQLDYEALHRRLAPEETQSAKGSWDDGSNGGRSHKYRYGKMTAKNYEKD